MAESRDTEITLGIGKLVGLFFLLVIVCAVAFGMGYTYGRNGNKQLATLAPDAPPAASTSAGAKPLSGQQTSTPGRADCPNGQNCQTGAAPAQDLGFYKAVEQKEANAHLAPAQLAPQQPPPAAQPSKPSQSQSKQSPVASTMPATGTGYMVQVAAVSKREDAEVLQDALRRKQYPVLITSAAGDRLFHVQIGPFSDTKDAEATRARLVGDGYNPILKR